MLQSRFFQMLLLFAAFPSFAYMGPGAGLTAFGCLVALLAGIWYTFKGFLWLPLKRRFSKKVDEGDKVVEVNQQASNEEPAQMKKSS